MRILASQDIIDIKNEFEKGITDEMKQEPDDQRFSDVAYNLNTRYPAANTSADRKQALMWAAYDIGQLVSKFGSQDFNVAPLYGQLADLLTQEQTPIVALMNDAISAVRAGKEC
jgi:hypothetical protein